MTDQQRDAQTASVLDFKMTGADVMQFLAEIKGIVYVPKLQGNLSRLLWCRLLTERIFGRGFNDNLIATFERVGLEVGLTLDDWVEVHEKRYEQSPLELWLQVADTYRPTASSARPFDRKQCNLVHYVNEINLDKYVAGVFTQILGVLKTEYGSNIVQRELAIRKLASLLHPDDQLWVAVALRL